MSFEQTVEAHHKLAFTGNVKMVAQQLQNRLRAAVTIVTATGEAQDAADLMGALDYIEGEDRSRRNVENVPERSRRWLVRPLEIKSGQYIDTVDKFDLALDPTGQLMKNHVKAVDRGIFDRIMGVRKGSDNKFEISGSGILGKVTEGKRPNSNKALPAANYTVHGGTGLTLTKLRAATEAMELQDFGLETDDQIYAAISPKQKTDLLNIAMDAGLDLNKFEVEQIKSGERRRCWALNGSSPTVCPTTRPGNA
ncbi:phage capsid protein [Roseobacter sp. TSBP12]|uniref:phage capsid protein n=1 Tax=Roseobacter sp. TSBP12 TaxID=1236613 RepID=UPI001D0155E8|nr:phage capsid protein [Roseobacter sp. TSBP12]